MKRKAFAFFLIASAVAIAGVLLAAPAADAKPKLNPIIFVHGSSGSGAQFESQAMRFSSNGYPPTYIRALEYDSSALNLPVVFANLDALIAELQAFSGQPQVDLLGHSLGTFVCQQYLASSAARAANVAHYVNIDGGAAAAPPGGVPTLALWAGDARPVQPVFGGAINVTIPGAEHVQCASSPDSFYEMYSFFQGAPPATTDILPGSPGNLAIKGRVDAFPQNTGLAGATLEIWEVDGATGLRKRSTPEKTFLIDATGDFGPTDEIKAGKYYEFAIVRAGLATVNYYYEPFLRSDQLVRLNVGDGLSPFIDSSPNHVSVTVLRNKEFCADKGAMSDELSIDGTQVLNLVTAPCQTIGGSAVAMFAFDDNSDMVTDVFNRPFPFFPPFTGFLSAVDLYIPTAPPGTVPVTAVPRGDFAATRTVNVPNLPSTTNRVVVQLNDFEQ